MNRIDFDVREAVCGDVLAVCPKIDGVDLIGRVGVFESSRGWSPAGAYDGLIPSFFRFGPLLDHYLGHGRWEGDARVPLLGCDCGEWGCWPLYAQVAADDDVVTWSEFHQPFRDAWDYTGLGPLVFERDQYERAISGAIALLPGD